MMQNCSMVRYTKFRDGRPIRSRVILGKPEGVAPPPPPLCQRGLRRFNLGNYKLPIYFTSAGGGIVARSMGGGLEEPNGPRLYIRKHIPT